MRNSYPYGMHSDKIWYECTRADIAQRIFHYFDDRTLPVLDLGCGKGYLLYCLTKLGFQKADGVEYNKKIAGIARQNMERLGLTDKVHIYQGDAVDFEKYDDYQIFFMFHPFKANIMERVVELVEQSLARKPRKATVVYYYPQDHYLWDDSPMFFRNKERMLSMTNPELRVYYYEFDPEWENRKERPDFRRMLSEELNEKKTQCKV